MRTRYLQTTGASVNIGNAAPPSAGQVLVATSTTTAHWGNPGALTITTTLITNNSGGVVSTTLAAITSPTAVTNNSGGSVADTTLAAITTGGGTYPDATPTKDAIAKLAVLGNANAAAVIVLKNGLASLAARLNTLIDELDGSQV